jgi:hypothetical protein
VVIYIYIERRTTGICIKKNISLDTSKEGRKELKISVPEIGILLGPSTSVICARYVERRYIDGTRLTDT